MSKGSMLMGTVKGKLGDAVFYRRAGAQQQRAYIQQVKDAKTEAQYAQRSQLANLVAFYRSARTLLDHSFTSRNANQSSYNAFVSENFGKIKVYMEKDQARVGSAVCAPYVVSTGPLPSIRVTGSGVDAATDIALGELSDLSNVTIGEFAQAVVDSNPSIQMGDQLLYLSLVQSTDVQTGFPIVRAAYYEVTLVSTDARLLSSVMPAQAIAVKNGFLAHGEKVADGGFCWILSRKTADGVLQASRQSLIVTSTALYKGYSNATALTRALTSYGATATKLLVPGDSAAGGVNAVASISSVAIAGTTLINQMEEFVNTAWGSSASLAVNGSNLSEVESVVVSVKVDKAGEKTAAITATDVVATATSITGTLAIPSDLQGGTLKSVSITVDGSLLYTMTTKEKYTDPDNPLG